MAKHRKRRADYERENSKRRKLSAVDSKPLVEIQSIQTLQKVLTFAHGLDHLTIQDTQALRLFLRSINNAEDSDLRVSRRGMLLQYLQDEAAAQHEEEPACFDRLVKLWSSAGHCDNEEVYPAATSLLALFLSTISSSIEFRNYGNRLCHQLTRDDSFKIFEKGLSAHKKKPRIISQSLRLLTEIVKFDGGRAAKRVYRQREITFKRLGTFLSMRSDVEHTSLSDRPTVAVRTRALRYLFANIKLQSPSAKREILIQGKIIREVFEGIHHDSYNIIQDILAVVNIDIINDETVPQEVKSKIFTETNLSSIAKLYNYQSEGTPFPHRLFNQDRGDIPSTAHRLLVTLCTQPNHGVKVAQSEWFSSDKTNHRAKADQLIAGESSEVLRKSESRTQVVNTAPSSFLQSIRPHASILEKDLLLAVFKASPELVPEYFFKKRSFSFEPKLTATWVGYSSFLLSTIQLPVPNRLLCASTKRGLPPPVIDMIEHILPQAMTKKIATKCLHENSDLITLFGVRILIAAFQKFKKVIDYFRQLNQTTVSSHVRDLWEEAASDLLVAFSQRVPEMNQVVVAFRSCDEKKLLLREALAHLLNSYYLALPHIALETNLDISPMISDSFEKELATDGGTRNSINNLYLIHLLDIGRCSSSMRWWHRPDNAPLSPFTLILKLCVERQNFDEDGSIQMMMRPIMEADAIICQHTSSELHSILIRSFRMVGPIEDSNIIYRFLDNCFVRLSRRAAHYYEYIEEFHHVEHHAISDNSLKKLGLLAPIIMEQWPLFLDSATSSDFKTITRWLTLYFRLLAQKSADSLLLQRILVKIRKTTKDKDGQKLLKQAIKELGTGSQKIESPDEEPPPSRVTIARALDQVQAQTEVRQQVEFTGPPAEDENHPGLNKWRQMEIEEAVTTGAIGQLMLCLSSKYEEIRKQAMLGMQAFMSKLKLVPYSEKQQIYLLSGEFTETAQGLEPGLPLPHFASVMAAKALLVLTNPLHPMYSKVNKFLTEGPVWMVDKLPLYWIHRIMYNAPTIDESHYKQLEWLLETMADGLRTAADVELYRRCHVLEPLVSLLGSPFLPSRCKENVALILYRCICVNGSSTLITRHGIMSWIRSFASLNSPPVDSIKVISKASNVGLSVTDERVDQWSDGTIETVLDVVNAAQMILST